ncbi:hypothetical protein VLK31_18985 [Variovorax sp. H27-G14]|uniref:hypothetical protein n=1 Tax=Variovorax sp. H27-G14 TaxID=3111914 RepID=UPI0038FC262B
MAIGAAFGMNLHSGMESLPGWVYWAIFGGGLVMGLVLRGWVKAPEPVVSVATRPGLLKKK